VIQRPQPSSTVVRRSSTRRNQVPYVSPSICTTCASTYHELKRQNTFLEGDRQRLKETKEVLVLNLGRLEIAHAKIQLTLEASETQERKLTKELRDLWNILKRVEAGSGLKVEMAEVKLEEQ
jgi:hypothetical protein